MVEDNLVLLFVLLFFYARRRKEGGGGEIQESHVLYVLFLAFFRS